ncbi:MAG: protein kinase [Muribaculaceae bacterium]|nr:protein kinase [Muribaculaceae bacterium]
MADNDKTIGSGRRRNNGNDDAHATGRAPRGNNDDAHATGRAPRGNNDDAHATGKAGGRLSPFEQKGNADLRNRLSDSAGTISSNEWPDEFVLDGVKYKNDGVLSASSGEAIVFTVSRGGKKYALKLYYYDPDHRPNHVLLEKIRKLGGSGLLVNIVSHGEWDNPNRPGEKNDYELMDFCEGGSLDGVILEGDERALAEVAVRMASAIDFLAKHGILHRDIKPANFFYADKERTQIVLADFGISVECAPGEFVKIDEMRSPVYAAPEFYTNVPGEPTEVGVESDYFSLGVALLCLWMGKDRLTANESQLLRSKLNETLPMPDNMSDHMVSLIKGLTRLKMNDRVTFEDIKRWVKGETLSTGESAAVNSDFSVVFNSSKNQVANSPAELAHFLIEDKALGKKYIYSGRVTRWLEDTNRNELAVNVEEIAENIYPSNQDAGLMAVAYLLDPAMDYVTPDGQHFTNPADIVAYVLCNPGIMSQEVVDPASNLMIYLSALKLDKTVATMRDYVGSMDFRIVSEEEINNFIACFYLAMLIDPSLPCPLSVSDGWQSVDSVEEAMEVFHKEGDLDLINKVMLCSQPFILWLAARNPALAGRVRMLHDNDTEDVESPYYNSYSPYRIAYELMPEADFDFNTDPNAKDRVYTIPEVGGYLNRMLIKYSLGWGDAENFEKIFCRMDNDPLGDYLRARGEHYMTFLSWNRYCMDDESEDNTGKPGPYDLVIGAYKSTAGFLGHAPKYLLGDHELHSPDDLKTLPKEMVAEAIAGKDREYPDDSGKPVAWLDAWLTVFFQEDPKLDLSAKFTYEKKTAEYVDLIAEYAPDNYYVKRYRKALSRIDTAAVDLDKSENKIKRKRIFFLIAAGIPTLIMLICSWFFDLPDGNPIKGHFWSTYWICAVCAFVAFIAMSGFWGAIIPGAVGGLVLAGFAWAGFAWFPSILYLIAGLILIIAAFLACSGMFTRKNVNDGLKIEANTFQYRQLDALYFAYRDDSDNLDTAVTDLALVQGSEDETVRENIGFAGWIWTPLVWMMFLLWFFATPQISGSAAWVPGAGTEKSIPGKWVIGKWDARYAGGSTRIVCNIDSVVDGKVIYGTMVIAGQTPVEAQGHVSSENDSLPKYFHFFPRTGDTQKQCITAEYDKNQKKMTGYYYDRKGIMHQIEFVSTPLDSPAPAKASAAKSQKASKPAKKAEKKPVEQPVTPADQPAAEPTDASATEDAPSHTFWEDTM